MEEGEEEGEEQEQEDNGYGSVGGAFGSARHRCRVDTINTDRIHVFYLRKIQLTQKKQISI